MFAYKGFKKDLTCTFGRGIRLADELAQWMRTGTVSYAGQAEGIALRLAEIIRQIVNEEHS